MDSNNYFLNFHIHSEYSKDGLIKIPRLAELYKNNSIKSICVTDHGNIFCLPELYFTAKKNGMKPIIGMESYTCKSVASLREEKDFRSYYHQILILKKQKSYNKFIELHNEGHRNFYKKPLIEFNKIFSIADDGIIATSSCVKSVFSEHILNLKYKELEKVVNDFISVFTRDSFYLEIIAIDFEKQKIINKFLLEYAKKNNIKVIVTTDSHYYDKDQNEIYKAISKLYNYYDSDVCDLYLKNREDVYKILNYFDKRDIDWLFDNLLELENSIEEINIEFDNTIPQVYDRDYLINQAKNKLISLGLYTNQTYLERLKKEIEVYDKTESWNYISVCYDIAKYCNENNILRSSGRGSASSSLLFYLLEMTFIDPIKYGLVFERFMDESRAKKLIF